MAWTAPLDWTTNQLVTAAEMDTYVSANTLYLKDVLDGVQSQAVRLRRAEANSTGQYFELAKARGSITSPTDISANDELGNIYSAGYYNGAYRAATRIKQWAVGVASTHLHGAIDLITTRASDGAEETAMRIRDGAVRIAEGTSSLPGLTWMNDATSGFYRTAGSHVGLTISAADAQRWNNTQTQFSTANHPAITFIGDTNTGWSSQAADAISGYFGGNNLLVMENNAGSPQFRWNGNLQVGGANAFGGGLVCLGIANATTAPTTNPSNGGVLYVVAGQLRYRGSSGTITNLANA